MHFNILGPSRESSLTMILSPGWAPPRISAILRFLQAISQMLFLPQSGPDLALGSWQVLEYPLYSFRDTDLGGRLSRPDAL